METKYGKIKRVSQFKYLDQIIQENGIETKALMPKKWKQHIGLLKTYNNNNAYLNTQN